jgi:DegV family protein with EDD domain
MTIKIVTDSTCDLPESIIEMYDITVMPLYINIGDKSYLDRVELSREAFYQRLPEFNPPPTTAAPAPERFRETYERLADEGATEILSIHISKNLSATVDIARVGAEQTKVIPVTIFDSRQLSLGTGFLVRTAAKAVAMGQSIAEIVATLKEQISRTHVFAALDTLEFLKRSGRISWAMASLGSLLQMKPLLRMYDGNPTSERARTHKGAVKRLAELLKEVSPLEEVALVHTHAKEKTDLLYQRTKHLLPEIEIPTVDITPVIGAHIGPDAVGFACISARQR